MVLLLKFVTIQIESAGLYDDLEEGMMNWPYVDAQYINIDYDGDMTIPKAYEWLKTLPEFEGAEDA